MGVGLLPSKESILTTNSEDSSSFQKTWNDTLSSYRRVTDTALESLRHARRRVQEEKKLLKEAKEHLQAVEKAQELFQSVAQQIQQQAHQQIARVVTRCLETVFDDPYEFKIYFEQKRGKTEARIVLVRRGNELRPTKDVGGGVVDVVAFALEVAVLVLKRPPARRMLLLDEPFKHLSENYRPRVRELIIKLSQELGIQFIIITHDEEFQIGKVISL